ncbi:hypothetical protein KJ359_005272 [Pestalotiopsis sp. 9143b]|nr:hypothetical protein KJ359_005272 [Pestalotiopsis sp. 9143b]
MPCTSDLDRGTADCKFWWARRPSNGHPGVDPDRVADKRCDVCHAYYVRNRRRQQAQEKKKELQEKRDAEARERREREAARTQQEEGEPWLRVKRGLQQERERRIQYRLGEQRLQQTKSMLDTPGEVADQDKAGWAPGADAGGPVCNPENPWGDQRQSIEPAELLVPVGEEEINGENQISKDEALPRDETPKRPHKKKLSFYPEDDDKDDDEETDEDEEEDTDGDEEEDTDEEDHEDYYEGDKNEDEEEDEYYKDFNEGLRASKNKNAKRKHIEDIDSGIGTEISENYESPQDENETVQPSIETDD